MVLHNMNFVIHKQVTEHMHSEIETNRLGTWLGIFTDLWWDAFERMWEYEDNTDLTGRAQDVNRNG